MRRAEIRANYFFNYKIYESNHIYDADRVWTVFVSVVCRVVGMCLWTSNGFPFYFIFFINNHYKALLFMLGLVEQIMYSKHNFHFGGFCIPLHLFVKELGVSFREHFPQMVLCRIVMRVKCTRGRSSCIFGGASLPVNYGSNPASAPLNVVNKPPGARNTVKMCAAYSPATVCLRG